MGPTLKNGNIEFEGINVPNKTIPPGGQFEVEMVVRNGAGGILFDPDSCSNSKNPCTRSGGTTKGYCVEHFASVEGGGSNSSTNCVRLAVVGSNIKRTTLILTAPDEPGQHTVSGYIQMTNSGERASSQSATIAVGEDTTVPDDDNGDTSDGSQDSGGGLLQTAVDNPVGTVIIGGLGLAAMSRLIDESVSPGE